MEKDPKALELLKLSKEERDQKYEEADLQDAFEAMKDQARADIRKGLAEIRRIQSEMRGVEKNPTNIRIGSLADSRMQLKANEEKVEEMKKLFVEFFDEEFGKFLNWATYNNK